MTVFKIKIRNNAEFEVHHNNDDTTFAPAIVRRILNDAVGFYDKRILLESTEDGKYLLKIANLAPDLLFGKEYVFDLVMYDQSIDKINFVSVEESFDLSDMSGIITSDEFNISYALFKTGVGRMFLKVTAKPNLLFVAKKITELDEHFEIELGLPVVAEHKIYLNCRSTSKHNGTYTTSLALNEKNCSSNITTVILPKTILSSHVKSASEIWDFLIEWNGKLYDILTDGKQSSDYFEISDAFSGKLFSSENKFLSIWTREGANKRQRKVKVAIIGSCFSKEAFHSVDYCNPDYKRFYENGFVCWHQSFVALMSPPVEYDPTKIDDPDEQNRRVGERYAEESFLKTTLESLKKYKPDYLVIDTYIEVAATLFEANNGGFITDSYYLMNTSALREMDKKKKYHPTNEQKFELFKDAYNRFLNEISKIIPNHRIVLVRTHPSIKKMVNGKLEFWEDKLATEYQTALWERNDDYIVSVTPGLRVIDMRFGNYYSDQAPHLTFSRNHMNNCYYKDLMNQFNKIVLQDMLKKDG